MNRDEFEERTGFFPSQSLYEVIEKHYAVFPGDKDEFCKAYRENEDGLAWRIQTEADTAAYEAGRKHEMDRAFMHAQIVRLGKDLERMQNWRPYESPHNVSQADYEKLARGAEDGKSCHYMTDEDAVRWICDEFGFDSGRITIIHEVDGYEINNCSQIRGTGRKIDRRPVYCATDYQYIRFDVSHWQYEAWDGQLRPYYD